MRTKLTPLREPIADNSTHGGVAEWLGHWDCNSKVLKTYNWNNSDN